MEEEIKQNESENVANQINGVDYIDAIKKLKSNTVDKADYENLKKENEMLLESLINGETIEKPVEDVDIDKLRDDLFNSESNNLEYIKNALQLRSELIKRGEKDPFLPYGKNIVPTKDDIETAEKVANILQECVDYADGDSSVFTTELQRVMIDTPNRNLNLRR